MNHGQFNAESISLTFKSNNLFVRLMLTLFFNNLGFTFIIGCQSLSFKCFLIRCKSNGISAF